MESAIVHIRPGESAGRETAARRLMLEELRFNGAAVLVTGAGSGIGRATCLVLAELGASVILVGRRLEALRETEALLAPWNTKTECFSCDVSDEDNVIALHAAVAA